MNTYGYIRVSTQAQDTKRQEIALKEYAKENKIKYKAIYTDRQTGKNFDRLQYKMLKEQINPGDILVIKELDRLGRNMDKIKNEWNYFSKLNVSVVILDNPILTTLNKSDLEKRLISDIVFSLMSYLAEKERIKIVSRVKEGLQKAKEYGTKSGIPIGRPGIVLHKDFEKYYRQWQLKKITAIEFSKLLGIHRSSLYRHINFYKENKLDLKQQDSKPEKCLIKAKEINETKIKAIETKVYTDFDDDTVLWYMERLKIKLKEDISYSRLHKLFEAYGHDRIKWVYKNLDNLEVKGLDRYSNFLYHVRYSKKITQ